MKKFEGILFCTDLDGTLFADDKTLSKQNRDAIDYFKSEGGLFTFITGRVPLTAVSICEKLRQTSPYGCVNGGGIYDPVADKFLWCTHLHEDINEIIREIDERMPDMGIQYNTETNVYFAKDNPAMCRFRAATGLPNIVRRFDEVDEPVLKTVFAHDDPARIDELEMLIKSHPKAVHFDSVSSERGLYEILPKGYNKGTLLIKMAELFGISMDKTVAVGDYYNDIQMLKNAKAGFAVANALDEVKAHADYITVSNNDNAIAAIIDLLDNNKIPIN